MTAKRPALSILILNFNNKELTAECIVSVLKSRYKDFEIIMLDNGSADDSFAHLSKRFGHEPRVRPVRLEKNLGFTGGYGAGKIS